jgi:quinol monooxygenase YgiN
MYGLIIRIRTKPGKRNEYISVLSCGFQKMGGCHSYIFAEDPADADLIWVTEIWESHEAHDLAINRPDVRASINDVKSRDLIIEREMRVVVKPVAGQGLFNDGAWRPEKV